MVLVRYGYRSCRAVSILRNFEICLTYAWMLRLVLVGPVQYYDNIRDSLDRIIMRELHNRTSCAWSLGTPFSVGGNNNGNLQYFSQCFQPPQSELRRHSG